MKRMKKIIGCLVGVLLTAEAWAGGTLTLGSHVFTQGDSLHIELLLNLSDAKAGNAEAYLYTPVLRGAGRLQELPAVVVSGRRRARADHRRQALQPSPGYLPPYRTLYARNRKDSIIYKVSVAYSPWMEHASLVLMRERRDCCRMKMLGVELLPHAPIVSISSCLPICSASPWRRVVPFASGISSEKRNLMPLSSWVNML